MNGGALHRTASIRAARAAIARALWRWLAWQTAIASASASSALSKVARGSRKPIMAAIWRFSPWPVPVTVFLTTLGGYSATRRPFCAGASSAMPRACPSFKVARASLLTKVSSTAASCGRKLVMTLDEPLVDLAQAVGQVVLGIGRDEAAGDEGEARAVRLDDAPARPPQAGIDADDANRLSAHAA